MVGEETGVRPGNEEPSFPPAPLRRGGEGEGGWRRIKGEKEMRRKKKKKKNRRGPDRSNPGWGSSAAAGGKSPTGPGRGGEGRGRAERDPAGRWAAAPGLRGRLRSAPRASGARGRSQGRQHCGAIKETGSALTAAGRGGGGGGFGPGALSAPGRYPALDGARRRHLSPRPAPWG